jgi:hypothetical protein
MRCGKGPTVAGIRGSAPAGRSEEGAAAAGGSGPRAREAVYFFIIGERSQETQEPSWRITFG